MNVNVHVFICDVIVYIACHLPLTHLLGIIVQFNKFYSGGYKVRKEPSLTKRCEKSQVS